MGAPKRVGRGGRLTPLRVGRKSEEIMSGRGERKEKKVMLLKRRPLTPGHHEDGAVKQQSSGTACVQGERSKEEET